MFMKFSAVKYLWIIPFILVLASCNQSESDLINEDLTLSEQVDVLIDNDDYETALSMLDSEDRDDPEIRLLLEKTHLNYAMHSMNTFDETEMRTRMNNALVQFTEVLRINPQNAVAIEQVQQIMDIYETIPERHPDPDVIEGLREVGFDY